MVPNGDERDKDIANAVRYAVDNGAKIINMSFAKVTHLVSTLLTMHSAMPLVKGSWLFTLRVIAVTTTTSNQAFQNRYAKHYRSKPISTWLDVGVICKYADQSLVASFSNFGQKSVGCIPGSRVSNSFNYTRQHLRFEKWYQHGSTCGFRCRCFSVVSLPWPISERTEISINERIKSLSRIAC